MRVDRWTVSVALAIALPHSAAAAPPPDASPARVPASAIDDELEGCEGLPDRSHVARYEPIGGALHVVARSGQRFIVFPQREGSECAVYPIHATAAHTAGRFGAASFAFAVVPRRCAEGSCWVALAVRRPDSRPLAAMLTDADCDASVALRPIKLFPGRDSLELICHAQAAGGWQERRLLFEVSGDAIFELFNLATGSFAAASPAERKAGGCDARPIGWFRVEKVADRPVLRVVDPGASTLSDGIGVLPARQLAFDPEQHAFVATGAPDVPTKVDERAACRR